MILYREIDVDYKGLGGHHDLVYLRLDDNVMVFYEFILKDPDTYTLEEVERILNEVGIDESKVDYLSTLQDLLKTL